MRPLPHPDRVAERSAPYAVAVLVAIAAIGLDIAGWPVLHVVPLSVPLGAVMLSAWYGGLAPGLVSVALTTAGAAWLSTAPRTHHAVSEPGFALGLLAYAALAVAVAWLAARVGRWRAAALTMRERFADLVDGFQGGLVWEAEIPSMHLSFVSVHAAEWSGYSLDEWRGQDAFLIAHAHPDDRHALEAAIGDALADGLEHACDHRFVTKDGRVVWLDTRVRRAVGPGGATVLRGLSMDVTKMKQAEEGRLAAERARVETEERFRSLVEQLEEHAIFMLDAAGRVMSWNAGAERTLGYGADEVIAQDYARFYPAEDVARGKPAQDLAAAEASGTFQDEALRVRSDGRVFWAEVTLTALRDDAGRLRGFAQVMRDVSARRRADDARRFLSDATRLLTSSLDYDETLAHIAALAVPRIGDWCTIDLVEPDGSLRRVGSAHVDPRKTELVRTLEARFPYRKTPQGIKRVLETGGVEHYPFITQQTMLDADLAPEHMRALHEVGIVSVIVVPLVGRETPLGAITLVAGDSGRHFDAADVQLARDLGQRAGMAVENARLYQSAQRAIAIRDEFLSIASHELKTPLTALRLQLHTILRGAERPPERAMPAERVSRAVDVAARQTERLAKLVDTLLDVSRISAGKLELEPETVDLGAAARETVQRLSAELAAAGCTVELRIEPGVVGRWDRTRIDQIVTNLLSNAAKYGAGRPIEVEVGGDDHVARLRVRDHGIGIPEEKLPRIFERFERGVSAREFGGLGLGLYIVRQIVEAHGGSVRAESLRDGAMFEVDLPRGREHRASTAEVAA